MQLFGFLCILHTATLVLGQPNNDFEIKTLTGEPNYKSVNLTWGVEDITLIDNNQTADANTRTFTVFYCELQSWGPHRCKSKILEDNEVDAENQQKQYSTVIDNLRMATKYSFHVKPQNKRGEQKASGRADFGDNGLGPNGVFQGQTIVIPTKGFLAHATKCLPHASEIEVETGPYFGGRIVAEGGVNCEVQGDYLSDKDKYVMRIDHDRCGSKVDHETLTVKTFITVQENLGIFTHSTRRFLVVCTYQPDTLTVRASFSVPGKASVAAVSPDWISDRGARDRKFKMVGKSALVLKEDYSADNEQSDENTSKQSVKTAKELAIVNIKHISTNKDAENIIDNLISTKAVKNLKNAKYARLIDNYPNLNEINGVANGIRNPSSEYTGLIIAVSLSVILLGALIFILHKESYNRRTVKS